LADKVFATKSHDFITSFITCKIKNEIGNIGLIATHTDYRGKSLGRNLINHVHNWYLQNNIKVSEVVTQKANEIACAFYENYGFKQCLLTTSCTDALEMSAILLDIQPGDEVIMPSFTFVSTANAFELRGAKIIFADSRPDHPGMDELKLESLITKKTKAIVVVHYAGVATDMDLIMNLANANGIFVVEDAAHCIDSFYKSRSLGSIGHLAAFSFHETKNIQCGEGGMLVINDEQFFPRAEIIREKGTNRSSFFRGEVDKYGWVDIGSSFLPSEIIAAFLFGQLENMTQIQDKRKQLWNVYNDAFKNSEFSTNLQLPYIPDFATQNGHMYYVVTRNLKERQHIIDCLKKEGIYAAFHYQSLHQSNYFKQKHDDRKLDWSDYYTDTLLRLPLYFELETAQAAEIAQLVINATKDFNNSIV
jgi:dTDP-4-amino-4,6-dideoxygalactose transaminase